MKQNVAVKMEKAAVVFKKCAKKNGLSASGWLTDNYYILEGSAVRAAAECKKLLKTKKGSDILPGLFDTCTEICLSGVLPDETELAEKLKAVCKSAAECSFLPLAFTCALVEKGAEGAAEKNIKLLANSVKSLRKLEETDFERISERLNPCEEMLRADPAGIYPVSDSRTKAAYRNSIYLLAAKNGISETEFTRRALEKAKKNGEHIGKYVFAFPKRRKRGTLFLIMEILFPAFCAFAAGVLMNSVFAAVALYFPLWEIFKGSVERASLSGVAPRFLPSLDPYNDDIIPETLTVVSTIMPEPEKARETGEHLENVYLGNRCKKLKICCLADLKGASKPVVAGDKAAIKAMVSVIEELNKKYGGGFILAVRQRSYSETQDEFTGRERKRGAITDLVKAIKGDPSGFSVLKGDMSTLHSVKYIAALDADTLPEFDGIRELAAIAAHPLNRPKIKNGRVVSGYGIFVPHSVNRLSGEKTSFFAKIMAGESGLSAYDTASSERYNDLFGEGIFCGKGLIDIEAFYSLLCDGLPKERILSHDIIEGGILRAGYVPKVQMTDGFPQSPIAYFLRLDRWIRGDWQNAPFIFGRNPLNALSRYKLLDNLRRSATPVICTGLIIASVFMKNPVSAVVCIASLLALVSSELFSGLNSLIHGGFSALSALFYSQILPSALGAFSRAFISLAFSAREAFVSLRAITKALWRMLVSKRNLLEWTTAAGGEKKNIGKKKILSCIPAAAVSAFLIVFGSPLHKLIGFIILFDIPLGLFGDKKSNIGKGELSQQSRERLADYTAAAWGYFEEQCGRENNFLPPDNIQLAPARAVAKRTSPTNIGLMLVSLLAARDMGFITTGEMCMRLRLSLSTVEKLEKYHGNLLNWYSTETLEPLLPKFVSTVDSGNFLCCLTALAEGLKEYAAEYAGMDALISRIRKIADETDLTPLYNKERALFYIGIDAETGKLSESCYDLFMSEARMTAYYAVAKRIIPKKHWGAMGRIIVSKGRYSGLVSWTGTAFEYFMPELFIPSPVGSITNESLHFCIYCQKKRCGKKPFGISESGFYAFDSELNYQYKAHGAQKIGLRRGLNDDLVISPYSSFLMLAAAPEASVRNLQRLEKYGVTGKYGFFEAVDYTRCSENGGFSVVSSYMAHHIGMSIIAADNALNENRMQKRFMADVDMRGAASLLEEKIPTGTKAFRDIRQRETPRIRERTQSADIQINAPSPYSPRVSVYSNGRMSCFISDCGTGVTVFDGMDINVRDRDNIARPQGVFAVFAAENEKIPFTKGLDRASKAVYGCTFMRDRAEHRAESGNIKLKMTTGITKNGNCEIRSFTVENTSHHEALNGNLFVYFEPCLEKSDVFLRHPAFSRLFITDEYDGVRKCMVFRRRNSTDGASCAAAAGFADADAEYTGSRETALQSPNGIFSVGDKTAYGGEQGNPDCCCAFKVNISLAPREKTEKRFIISADETADGALSAFAAVCSAKRSLKLAPNPFYGDAVTAALSGNLLPDILFPHAPAACGEPCFSINDLWCLGISGDIPIISVEVDSADEAENILPYIRFNKQIRNSGIPTDLAVIYSNPSGYLDPVTDKVKKLMNAESCSLMTGVKGGVHPINSARYEYVSMLALKTLSAVYSGVEKETAAAATIAAKPIAVIDKIAHEKVDNVKAFNFTDGKINIKKGPYTVDIPWIHIISGKTLGTMVSDKALGFTWALNSGENKITPWYNDNMSDNRGEALFLKKGGVIYDLAAISDVIFTPRKAEWKCRTDGLEISFEVTVGELAAVKRCRVNIKNNSASETDFELLYSIIPVLGESRERASAFSYKRIENGGVISNALSPIKGAAALQCVRADSVNFSRREIFSDTEKSDFSDDICLAVGRKISLAVGGSISVTFALSWGACESAAIKAADIFDPSFSGFCGKKIESGNEKLDIFCNSFLYPQIKSCRFLARTGFYQCSGAYGFRGQLQDSLAFIETEPILTRNHLIKCAAVQFEQGDVLHWWHITVNSVKEIHGIRTRCSDDMLWLPYVFCEYLNKTGDEDILKFKIPYIKGRELRFSEKECYMQPERSEFAESILYHCIRAVDRSLRFGENGMPLIGSCDWNDGFSDAGSAGKGESVWLAMFQIIVLKRMSAVCRRFNETKKADEYDKAAAELVQRTENFAWDGDRYIRAVLKNGVSLGRNRDFIDILPQAFAAFAEEFDPERVKTALNTAYEKLFDEEKSVIKLLSPAFDEYERNSVGYIASYPDGIRENGGQYTHGAVWLAMAFFKIGDTEKAMKLVEALLPLNRYADEASAVRYRAEPYVMPGDVSTSGRAGWTHFTGSAAWFYRCILENLPEIRRFYDKKCKGE